MSPWGKYSREKREALGIPLTQMASYLNISAAHLSNLENGLKTPTDQIIDRFINFFDLTSTECEHVLELASMSHRTIEVPKHSSPKVFRVTALYGRALENITDYQLDIIEKVLDLPQSMIKNRISIQATKKGGKNEAA